MAGSVTSPRKGQYRARATSQNSPFSPGEAARSVNKVKHTPGFNMSLGDNISQGDAPQSRVGAHNKAS